MFVVFEGIDGSGKTTVSNQVAMALRRRGIEVEHIREGGEFASSLVSRMREFGKDPRNMVMAPITELLFYVARDAQLLAECIRPALKRGGLVFADRYLYSYEVLGHFGRGLPTSQIRPILDAVADGIWPDLVILLDVDPFIARARRKVSKLGKKPTSERSSSSRKGLQGVGTLHRLREGYLALAEREPKRWLVVDNADPLNPEGTLEAIVERITDAIEQIWQGRDMAAVLPVTRVPREPAIAAKRTDFEAAREAFYQAVEARALREVPVAAYLLAGLRDDHAYDLRDRWAEDVPHIIAYGMRGLNEERAWTLRERLSSTAPYYVARSLDGQDLQGPRVEAMRERFVDSEPQAVLATLDGDDSEVAWAVRERLVATNLPHVVASLKRLASDRAWELRERLGAEARTLETLMPLVTSVTGLADDRAWRIRDRYQDLLPSEVLWSLVGVNDARSWVLRSHYASQAPKIVLRTIDQDEDPRAWALRRVYAPRVKEALDSMIGLDGYVAWAIRTDCLNIWPSTTIKSLGPLILSERGNEMALRTLEQYPDNISLLKHIARLVTRASQSRQDFEKAG